jgi:predicted O-methyltransferase YrrM
MSDTYAKHAKICAKFYELTVHSDAVGDFIFTNSGAMPGQRALFVGGMFGVAAALIARGLALTVVDYTDEMVSIGKARLPDATVMKADLKALPFQEEFDLLFVVGRVFTHMISDSDLSLALSGCRNSLRVGGKLFADNYEDVRIEKTDYFNGLVERRDPHNQIDRISSTTQLSDQPFVVRWDARYSGQFENSTFSFQDSMDHRAYSRSEFSDKLREAGFIVSRQGDNFDETSFYTVAERMR